MEDYYEEDPTKMDRALKVRNTGFSISGHTSMPVIYERIRMVIATVSIWNIGVFLQ